jgi:hypothetical protein
MGPNLDLDEANAVAAMAASLLKDMQQDRNQIPVELFKRAGLPLLLSQDEQVDISAWVDIAGNPQKSVDVVDSSGKILYTVPPIINTKMVGKIDPQHGKGIDLAIVENMQRLNSGHYPKRKARALVLDTVSPLLRLVIADPEALAQWNIVLKANGISEIGFKDAATGTPVTNADPDVWSLFDDDIEE